MNQKDLYVSLEDAKFLRLLGYHWDCDYAYIDGARIEVSPKHDVNKITYQFSQVFACPTIYDVHAWLREKFGCHVILVPEIIHEKMFYIPHIHPLMKNASFDNMEGMSYEKALALGISGALKIYGEKCIDES